MSTKPKASPRKHCYNVMPTKAVKGQGISSRRKVLLPFLMVWKRTISFPIDRSRTFFKRKKKHSWEKNQIQLRILIRPFCTLFDSLFSLLYYLLLLLLRLDSIYLALMQSFTKFSFGCFKSAIVQFDYEKTYLILEWYLMKFIQLV